MTGTTRKSGAVSRRMRRGAVSASAFAVFAVALLLISSVPPQSAGITTTNQVPDSGYSGDYYVIRYYANYQEYRGIIENALGNNYNSSNTSIDWTKDSKYY